MIPKTPIIHHCFFSFTSETLKIIKPPINILAANGVSNSKILLGISNNKAFYIITSEEEQVEKFVIDELGHNATIFDVKGAFLEKKRRVILTVIPTREYFKVTEGIKLIDENAFFVVTDSYQVAGGK